MANGSEARRGTIPIVCVGDYTMPHAYPDASHAQHYSGHLCWVLAAAQQVASAQGCPAVDAEHLALSLLDLSECAARRVLEDLGLDLAALRAELAEAAAAHCVSEADSSDEPPLTSRAERALQIAYVEARMDHGRRGIPFETCGRVGTQHLLLGLTSPTGEVALASLRRRGVFYGEVGEMVRRLDDPSDEPL